MCKYVNIVESETIKHKTLDNRFNTKSFKIKICAFMEYVE